MRNKAIAIICFILSAYCFAQKTVKPLEFGKDSIPIVTNIKIHDAVSFQDIVVTFEKVLNDSRCPKDVTCVRAGEATILVSIYKNGVFLKNKEIMFDAEGYVFESTNMFLKVKDYKIYATALFPYPKANSKIVEEHYNADFNVRKDYGQ